MPSINELIYFCSSIGFDLFGVIRPGKVAGFDKFTKWLRAGNQAEMHWLEGNLDKRADTSLVLENCQSIIVLGISYFNHNYSDEEKRDQDRALIARYAWGNDYHEVLKFKLVQITKFIDNNWHYAGVNHNSKIKGQRSKPQPINPSTRDQGVPTQGRDDIDFKYKVYTDTGPVLEKWLGAEAGLGFIGCNSCLINHQIGSYFLLASIFTTAPLPEYREKSIGGCGDCRRCIEACPTGAINDNQTIDARKCIAYHTIENKGDIPADIKTKMKNRIFGCDICQEVCPWNKFARKTNSEELRTKNGRDQLTIQQIKEMDVDEYQKLFKKSAIKRAGLERLKRNCA